MSTPTQIARKKEIVTRIIQYLVDDPQRDLTPAEQTEFVDFLRQEHSTMFTDQEPDYTLLPQPFNEINGGNYRQLIKIIKFIYIFSNKQGYETIGHFPPLNEEEKQTLKLILIRNENVRTSFMATQLVGIKHNNSGGKTRSKKNKKRKSRKLNKKYYKLF
jgi:hypothetical protein